MNSIHLKHGPEENKTYQFPEGPYIECFVIYFDFPIRQSYGKNMAKFGARAITVPLYPGRDTFELDQGHVTKKQPITVLVLLSESLGISQ